MDYTFAEDVQYTRSHEWVRKEGEEVVVGISDYAQASLSDVVYVELPEPASAFKMGEACAVVESVKAAEDIYAPVSGQVIAVNEELQDAPELVNKDPYGQGWLFRLKLENPQELKELMQFTAYKSFVEDEADH